MDKCPKCGNSLKIWQMSQYCPHCGVNIMFANYEPRFQKDRRVAEMSGAYFRCSLEKFKSAYIAGLPQKLKILFALIPLLGLLIPLGSVSVQSDMVSGSVSFWAMDLIYNGFMGNAYFMSLSPLSANALLGEAVAAFKGLILIYSLAGVSAVLILLTELLCFIGNKKSGIAMIVFSAVGILAFCLVPGAVGRLTAAAVTLDPVVSVKGSALWCVGALLFLFPVAGAVFALKKPPVRHFTPEDALRCSYREKWKKGEIDLLDVPAPIAETEEEKKEKQKLIAKAYNEDTQEGNSDG